MTEVGGSPGVADDGFDLAAVTHDPVDDERIGCNPACRSSRVAL
jgi:hypothetical protein